MHIYVQACRQCDSGGLVAPWVQVLRGALLPSGVPN
jgi:hypothetical protein